MDSSRQAPTKQAASRVAGTLSIVGVIAGFIAAFLVTAALVAKFPWWVAVPLGIAGLVGFFGGGGWLMNRQGTPKGWLTASACGAVLAVSPTWVLLLHGSPSATFEIPARFGRTIDLSVESLIAFVVPVGLTIALVSLAVYLLHPLRQNASRRQK